MKTKQDIEKLIELERESIFNEETPPTPLQVTKASNKIEYYKEIILYLSFNPKEEFVKSEVERLEKMIKSLTDQLPQWMKTQPKAMELKKGKEKYFSEFGMAKLKKNLKTCKFILE